MNFGFPLALTDRITLPSGVTGRIPFNVGQLQTQNHEAFAVHEIRFYCDTGLVTVADRTSRPPANFGAPFCSDAGPFLRVSLRAGPYVICDSLPLWALSASRDFTLEGAVWRFPLAKPLFIPPGMSVVATAERRTTLVAGVASEPEPFVGNNVFLSATLVGRVVTGAFPKTTVVPYIESYAPEAIAAGGALISGAQDLVNKVSAPLDVRYAIGRIGHIRRTGAAPGALYCFDCADVRLALLATLAWKTQAIFSDAEFHVAFDPCSRVLNLAGLTLPAGERLTFRAPAPVYTVTAADAWMPVIGLVADRKENV